LSSSCCSKTPPIAVSDASVASRSGASIRGCASRVCGYTFCCSFLIFLGTRVTELEWTRRSSRNVGKSSLCRGNAASFSQSPVASCSCRLFRDSATVVCGGAAGWFVMAAMDGDPRFETISTSLSLAIFSRETGLRRLGVACVATAFGASDRPRGRPRAFSFLLGARKVFDRPTRARSGTYGSAVLESPNCTRSVSRSSR
jgi:hypothetical protein